MPCAEAILAAGMRRVVVATQDPNPEIAGRGVAVLRQAGVAVDIGLCGEEARWMAAGHILRMTQGRPLVQLKIAVSADGLIAPGEGAPVWVTGPEARAYAHLLRAHADARDGGAQDGGGRRPRAHLPAPGPRQPLAAAGRPGPEVSHLAGAENVPDRAPRADHHLRRGGPGRAGLSRRCRGAAGGRPTPAGACNSRRCCSRSPRTG